MKWYLIFLKRSLVFPILLLSSISLHWLLRKAFLSLLAILWNSAFRWVYLSFSPLLLVSLRFTAVCKPSSDSHFAFFFCRCLKAWQYFSGSDGKEWGRPGFDPWVRKIPWRREWQPTPVFLPGEFHGQGSLAGYSPWGCKESDMTEWLSQDRNLA